jgi:hypothetical protein
MAGNLIEFTRATDPLDADFHRLRGEQVLDKLLRRYPDYAQNLQRAHQRLKDDPNYAPAMHRAAQALHEGHIRVFVSYRAGVDAEAARAIAEVFRDLSSGQATVTLADEFPARISGQDYKSEIESSIKTAHWFVFLVSEAREPSAWCMYETGMFRASASSRKMERLICIHHPAAALPQAIDEFQAVKATVGNLQPFLDGLFRRIDPLPGWDALNPMLSDDRVLAAADRIEKAFRPPRKPVSFNCRVTLEVRHPSGLATWADLASCAIETDRLTADLFGKIEPPATWGELVANVQGDPASNRWQEELHAVIVKASNGNVFRPISSTFECSHGGRVLRPVLHAMEHDGVGDEYRFHLYFLDDISSLQIRDVPEPTLALLTAVRMHNRVRWEVLHRYADVEWTRPNIEACAKAFSRIEREVRALGNPDIEQLCENYGEDARGDVKALLCRWQALRDPRNGELTLALARRDAAAIADGMNECGELNRRFFRLTLPVLEEVNSAAP